MRAGTGAALAVAVLLALGAGMWLGGHPEKLPEPLRDVFVDETTSVQAQATDLIEDTTIAGSARAAARRLAAGHGPLAAAASHTSRPRRTGSSGSPPAASSPGVGMTVVERQRLLVAGVFEDSPAEQKGIRRVT